MNEQGDLVMSEITPRQEQLLSILDESKKPLSGQALAQKLGVTRQVVVHDIALLRASGQRIFATPKGYLLEPETYKQRAVLAVSHRPNQTAAELNILVDCGLKVLDVRVEHQIYGELVGNLYLSSRRDVEHFLAKIRGHNAPLLSSLTDGVHYHGIEFDHAAQLSDATRQLKAVGIIVFD